MKKFKKSHIVALVGLAALLLVGGTFAYWNQTSTIENPFDTGSYGSTIKEDFKPSDGENWQPGVEVAKKVTAVNTGDTDLIVRARLDEKWARKSGGTVFKDNTAAAPLGFPAGYDVYGAVFQGGGTPGLTDGLTAADGTVVHKNLSTSADWVEGTDGWYYYRVNLAGGLTTDAWLNSVTLDKDADMGKFETKKYVSVTSGTNESAWIWVEYTADMPKYLTGNTASAQASIAPTQYPVLHNKTETTYAQSGGVELLGYSKSDYTLTVTVQTVQPTQDAINSVFGGGSTFTAPAGTSWVMKTP